MTTQEPLETRFAQWETARARISALEANGTYPHADEWAGSDDEAVELLHEAMRAVASGARILDTIAAAFRSFRSEHTPQTVGYGSDLQSLCNKIGAAVALTGRQLVP